MSGSESQREEREIIWRENSTFIPAISSSDNRASQCAARNKRREKFDGCKGCLASLKVFSLILSCLFVLYCEANLEKGEEEEGSDETALAQMRERPEGRVSNAEERTAGAGGGFGAFRTRLAPSTGDDVMKLLTWRDLGAPSKKLSSEGSDSRGEQESW